LLKLIVYRDFFKPHLRSQALFVENQKKVKEINYSAASSGEHDPKGFNKKGRNCSRPWVFFSSEK